MNATTSDGLTRLAPRKRIADLFPGCIASISASIRTKLLVAFLSITTLLVVLAVVGLQVLEAADRRAGELVQLQRQISAYRQLQYNATEQLQAAASAFLATNERELEAARRHVTNLAYDFDRAQFVGLEDARMLGEIKVDYNDLIDVGTRIVGLVKAGKLDEAKALHHSRSLKLADRLERKSYALVNEAESLMVQSAQSSRLAYLQSQYALLAVSVGAVMLALLLGYSISSSLIEPLHLIRRRLRAIAEGEFADEIFVRNKDELGELARNVNRMSRRLSRLYGELEAANRHKSTFLANMSHELRTPMNAIIGFNRLVMRRCKEILPTKQYENLGKIAISAEHLLGLINTVLDLSKIEAGHLEARVETFDIEPLLESTLRTIEPLLDGRCVVLSANFDKNLTPVSTDREKLRQIILNLLSNAAKFTDEGEVALFASTHNGQLLVSVRDTGIGIGSDQLCAVFEEFIQADNSSTRKYAGTGLGLAISRRLARLLGGDIEVKSERGVGSTFTLSIPVELESATNSTGGSHSVAVREGLQP